VLRQACRELAEWRSRGWADDSFNLSVNLSARQLEDPNLVEVVREILAETGIPANSLLLEITENVLLQSTARAHDLRGLGVRLAIDDFGTGYASLAYLKDLPVDVLKVARNFTAALGEDRAGDSIVRTILTLGRYLRLTCIAEGIETDAQAQRLKRMKCGIGQGFLFAKPMPAQDFVRWLRADQAPVQSSERLPGLPRRTYPSRVS